MEPQTIVFTPVLTNPVPVNGSKNMAKIIGKNCLRKKFYGDESIEYVLVEGNFDDLSLESMFENCYRLKGVVFDVAGSRSASDLTAMFRNCVSLELVDFGWSFYTGTVRSMSCMFHNCKSLKALDLGSFDTNSLVETTAMFQNCQSLELLNLDKFNAANVTDCADMFRGCNPGVSIVCRLDFRTWAIRNAEEIALPFPLRSYDSALWQVI